MIFITRDVNLRESIHGGNFTYIDLIGEDGKIYYTNVYDQCNNQILWKKICNNPDKIFAFEHFKLKKTKNKNNLLNADHAPEGLQEISVELKNKMLAHWGIN